MMAILQKIKKQHWIDAIWWLVVSSIGSLMPIWLTWFIFVMFQLPTKIETFIQNGEFAIYSAALMSTGFYIVTKDYATGKLKQFFNEKNTPVIRASFPAQQFFGFICFLIALFSALLFFGITIWNIPGTLLNLNVKLRNVSMI